MKLHSIIYLIVGAILVGFSYYITSVNENLDVQKFLLFIWIGYVFIGIGVIKMIFKIMSRPKKPKLAKENFHHYNQSQHNNPTQQNDISQQHKQQTQKSQHSSQQQSNQLIKFCSGCGSAVRHFDNFCYKCGSRMFHRK